MRATLPSSARTTVLVFGVLAISLLQANAASASSGGARTAAECEELGFVSDVAACSHCQLLAEHTADHDLVAECKSCCTETDSNSANTVKYASARFEADERWLLSGARWGDLVDRDSAIFGKRFKFVPVYHMLPRLVLTTKDGERTVVKVHAWEPGMVVDFLKAKLESP